MASDLPIIATKVGAIEEILSNNGFYVTKDNITEELIVKMEEVLNYKINNNLKKEYEKTLEKFSLEKYCHNFSSLLK